MDAGTNEDGNPQGEAFYVGIEARRTLLSSQDLNEIDPPCCAEHDPAFSFSPTGNAVYPERGLPQG